MDNFPNFLQGVYRTEKFREVFYTGKSKGMSENLIQVRKCFKTAKKYKFLVRIEKQNF